MVSVVDVVVDTVESWTHDSFNAIAVSVVDDVVVSVGPSGGLAVYALSFGCASVVVSVVEGCGSSANLGWWLETSSDVVVSVRSG